MPFRYGGKKGCLVQGWFDFVTSCLAGLWFSLSESFSVWLNMPFPHKDPCSSPPQKQNSFETLQVGYKLPVSACCWRLLYGHSWFKIKMRIKSGLDLVYITQYKQFYDRKPHTTTWMIWRQLIELRALYCAMRCVIASQSSKSFSWHTSWT